MRLSWGERDTQWTASGNLLGLPSRHRPFVSWRAHCITQLKVPCLMTLISKTEFPQVFRVHQKFDAPTCSDIKKAVRAELERLQLDKQVSGNQTVAITAGSRGISNIAEIIQSIAQYFLDLGAKPFIVPAMGSHGGGNSQAVGHGIGVVRQFWTRLLLSRPRRYGKLLAVYSGHSIPPPRSPHP